MIKSTKSKCEGHPHPVMLLLSCINKTTRYPKRRGTLAARAHHRPAGMKGVTMMMTRKRRRRMVGGGTLLFSFALTVRVLFCLLRQIRRR